jgi:hypothetical protein
MAQTAACLDIFINDNATFQDAWQFNPPVGVTSLDFTGNSFEMSVKASRDDVAPLVTFTSAGGQIVLALATPNPVVNMYVVDTVIQTDLPAAEYDYDLVMLDTSTPPIRTILLQGKIFVKHGVTET